MADGVRTSGERAVALATPRLTLREFREDDWSSALVWESDPEVARHRGDDVNTDPEVARSNIARAIAYQSAPPRTRFVLAVVPTGAERPIGWVMLKITDSANREAEIGWTIARAWQGRGYATEGARALLGFAFGDLGLHRVVAMAHAENAASERVMRKLGMRREGCFVEQEWAKGAWWDIVLYAILDREWREGAGA